MKKLQLLFTVCSLSLLTASPSNDQLQREIDQLKLRVDRMTSGSELPIGGVETPSAMGFILSADLLFWETQSDYCTYAYQISQSNTSLVPQSNQYYEVGIDWAWGFRVGAGYQFAHDSWKLLAEYTYLHPTGSASRAIANEQAGAFDLAKQTEGIRTNWGAGGALFAKNAQTTYALYYDYVSLQLEKNFCVSSAIDFATHFGLAAGWMTEKQTNTYTGGTDAGFLNTSMLTNENDNNYWGVGPIAGLGAFWNMGLGFSFFGDVSAEILVGKNRTSHLEQINDSSTEYAMIVFNGYRYLPQLFMQVGLAYDAYFNDGTKHLGVRAGWENELWFNQAVQLSEGLGQQYGDIQFSGFTLKVLFAF